MLVEQYQDTRLVIGQMSVTAVLFSSVPYKHLFRQVDRKSLRKMLEAAEDYSRKGWQKGQALRPPDKWNADQSSHVAIYACGENERAYEDRTGGVLANELFRILANEDLTSVSYQELVGLIGSVGAQQNPGVHGLNTHKLVFRIHEQ